MIHVWYIITCRAMLGNPPMPYGRDFHEDATEVENYEVGVSLHLVSSRSSSRFSLSYEFWVLSLYSLCFLSFRHCWIWPRDWEKRSQRALLNLRLNSCQRTGSTKRTTTPTWTRLPVWCACATLKTDSYYGFCRAATSSMLNVWISGLR